jgi:hypothetical protein
MIQNPKKTITVDFSIEKVKSSIPKIYITSDGKYRVNNQNNILNEITLECFEGLSLGVYIDFNMVKLSDTSTEITIEIRRKIGSFDNSIELQNANYHFQDLTKYLSEIVNLTDEEFDVKYTRNIQKIKDNEIDLSKPWYARKYIANLWLILGVCTLPLVIGVVILPIGIYAKIKKSKFENQ